MSLIQALQNPALYDHPVDTFEVIETHISWVLLTGEYVYKIKKPVDFGFLDFSTLKKRHHYCEEELRLNRRMAPQLYLGVVAITGSEGEPQLNGPGEAIEYAVKMRQFPQAAQLDRLLAAGGLERPIIDRLADRVAQFHHTIASIDADSRYGDPEHVRQPMLENFEQIREQIRACIHEPTVISQLDGLEQWTLRQLEALAPVIQSRKAGGFVRECHGDMHLRNIALWQDEIVLFDCIEFNPKLYWIDVISDIAFLVMDLEERGAEVLAQRFLNRYLEITGDYEGLQLLLFYKVYRAMVRAKVNTLRLLQEPTGSVGYQQTLAELRQYLALAQRYIEPVSPMLLINFGLSGAGKSFIARQLAEQLPAIQVRSDVERKRLYQVAVTTQVGSAQQQSLYSQAATDKTYARLVAISRDLLSAGYTVIVDAANLKRQARQPFIELAESMRLPWLILAFEADEATLKQRIVRRAEAGEDVSDATVAVLEQQLNSVEALSEAEQAHGLIINTGGTLDIDALVESIRYRIAPSLNR